MTDTNTCWSDDSSETSTKRSDDSSETSTKYGSAVEEQVFEIDERDVPPHTNGRSD